MGQQDPLPSEAVDVEASVRELLHDWIRAFEARDIPTVRSLLAEDDRFVWFEDGEARYQSADAVIAALSSFPSGLAFDYRLNDVRIVQLTDDLAWASMMTQTEVLQDGSVVSVFQGAVTMLVERDGARWRIVSAHSSSVRPAPQRRDGTNTGNSG